MPGHYLIIPDRSATSPYVCACGQALPWVEDVIAHFSEHEIDEEPGDGTR